MDRTYIVPGRSANIPDAVNHGIRNHDGIICRENQRVKRPGHIDTTGAGHTGTEIPLLSGIKTSHTPGITAHEGSPGEIPSASGITNVINSVIRILPMILSANPALTISRVVMYPVP
jgi:hypothetical protein